MTKITIITPCYNSENYIEKTVKSVLNQSAIISNRCELQYLICDGNSKDSTVAIINRIILETGNTNIKIISEPDKGMYDALVKGLKQCEGDICAYINAGDYYSEHAFDVVLDVFEKKKVQWLTGLSVHYNEKFQIIKADLPFRYQKKLIECGFYGRPFIGRIKLPFIQQESTFWRSSLNDVLDFEYLTSLKYAGDYYIWKKFSSQDVELYIVESYLGGFLHHQGQLSENKTLYIGEVREISKKVNFANFISAFFELPYWLLNSEMKKRINKKTIISFKEQKQKW